MSNISLVFQKPWRYWTFGIFLAYLLLAILISGFYKTFPLILKYASTVNWVELSLSIIFSIVIAILVSINVVFGYIRYRQRKLCAQGNTLAGIGTISGLAAGICPLCVTGLFPLILGAVGVSFSFASLPFKGLEVQILSITLLLLSLIIFNKSVKINHPLKK